MYEDKEWLTRLPPPLRVVATHQMAPAVGVLAIKLGPHHEAPRVTWPYRCQRRGCYIASVHGIACGERVGERDCKTNIGEFMSRKVQCIISTVVGVRAVHGQSRGRHREMPATVPGTSRGCVVGDVEPVSHLQQSTEQPMYSAVLLKAMVNHIRQADREARSIEARQRRGY